MWGLFGPENQSQLKRIRWNRDWQFFRGNHGNVHAGTFTVRLLSNLDWIEAQIVLCCLKSPASQRGNSPKSLRTFALSDHDERKTKAYWKQSKYIHFSVGFCLFSCSLCVCVGHGWWHGCGEPHTSLGDRLDAWAAPEIPQLRPCRGRRDKLLHLFTSDLCLVGTLQEVTIGSDCGCQQNCGRTALNCWQIGSVLSQWRAMMDRSPLLSEVLKLFFMDSLLHLHLLYCVSLVLFYVCVCLSDLSLGIWLHFCFDVVWKSPTLCSK